MFFRKQIRTDRRYPEDPASASLKVAFAVSLILHGIVIGAMIFLPAPSQGLKLPSGVVNVRLVSLPESGGGAQPSAPAVSPAEPPPEPVAVKKAPIIPKPQEPETPREVAPILEPKPKEKPAPEKRPKVSLKEKTIDRQKVIESAIERIEKKVEEPKEDSVSTALERLRRKVAESETDREPPPSAAAPGSGAAQEGPAGPPGAGGTGARAIRLIDIYRAEIAARVEKNWAYSPQIGGEREGLQARLVFKVMPDGEIRDIEFTERSNNVYLDESAYRAIAKTNPAPPHPSGIQEKFVLVGIRFTPEGIR
jgi:colicin import membrane protein